MWQDGFCRVRGVAAATSDKALVPCRTEEVWCMGKGVQGTHCIQEHQGL